MSALGHSIPEIWLPTRYQDFSRKGIFRQTLGLFRQLLRYFQQTSGFFINQQLTLFTTSDFLVYGSRFVTVGHGLSRFVTQHVRQFEANMNLFPPSCNLRLLHFDNACAICDHQKWLHYLHAFPIWPYSRAWILREHSEPPGMARVVKISCRNGSLTIHRLELLVIVCVGDWSPQRCKASNMQEY